MTCFDNPTHVGMQVIISVFLVKLFASVLYTLPHRSIGIGRWCGHTCAAMGSPDGGLLCGGLALFAVGWLSFSVGSSNPSNSSVSFSSGCFGGTVAASPLVLQKTTIYLRMNTFFFKLQTNKKRNLLMFLVKKYWRRGLESLYVVSGFLNRVGRWCWWRCRCRAWQMKSWKNHYNIL